MEDALKLTAVEKRFGSNVALAGASLTVRAGEVHGIVGENGAGKSTLIGVAAGSTLPESGSVEICGMKPQVLTPRATRGLGLAVVAQHPALLPDLTVLENLLLVHEPDAWPKRTAARDWARQILFEVGLKLNVKALVSDLTLEQRTLVEIAKALSLRPRVLILDEPTEPLREAEIRELFTLIREQTSRGVAVVYISHRIPEIKEISDRITVLRDGRVVGSGLEKDHLTESQIVELIAGHEVESRQVRAHTSPAAGVNPLLELSHLSYRSLLADVSLTLMPGEIVGLAGVSGNGQELLLRAAGGLVKCDGEVVLKGQSLRPGRAGRFREAGIAYLPSDRHVEGLFGPLSVRKNIGIGSLGQYARAGIISSATERARTDGRIRELAIRPADGTAPASTLSGGNQQKVMLARVLETNPSVLLADEPTVGIDVGARSEIYSILRAAADNGMGVVVLSTDVPELEAICDRVITFSRGHVTAELVGAEVSQRRITQEILTATRLRMRSDKLHSGSQPLTLAARLAQRATAIPLAAVVTLIIALGIMATAQNSLFLSNLNIGSLLTFWAGLVFIAYGQQIVMVLGGIDLSVGPLSGLLAIIASFWWGDLGTTSSIAIGAAIMIAAAIAVGLFHFMLIWRYRVPPIAATLATYIGIQGVSLALRPAPAGEIDLNLLNALKAQIWWLPWAAIVAFAVGCGLEWWLRFARLGLETRAVGSDAEIARRLGLQLRRVQVTAYVSCAALTVLGAVMLVAESGVGDPTQGVEFSLNSIVAVVLGGAALSGGRGTFLGTMVGALLLQETVSIVPFLQLSEAWNTWFPGLLLIIAGLVYGLTRRSKARLSSSELGLAN